MKITIDIDCTPEEARTFLGLPDVQPMQQALLGQMQDRMSGYLQAMEPDALVRTWLPVGLQNWEQMQKMFWSQMAGGGGSGGAGGSGGGGSGGGGSGGGGRGGDSSGGRSGGGSS